MANLDVFRTFAEGGEASSGNVRSEAVPPRGGDERHVVLYSYGTPVAYRWDGGARFDARSYSATTARQMGQARQACARAFAPGDVQVVAHEHFRRSVRLLGADLSGARP